MGRPILSSGEKLTGEKTDRYTGPKWFWAEVFRNLVGHSKYVLLLQQGHTATRPFYISHIPLSKRLKNP